MQQLFEDFFDKIKKEDKHIENTELVDETKYDHHLIFCINKIVEKPEDEDTSSHIAWLKKMFKVSQMICEHSSFLGDYVMQFESNGKHSKKRDESESRFYTMENIETCPRFGHGLHLNIHIYFNIGKKSMKNSMVKFFGDMISSIKDIIYSHGSRQLSDLTYSSYIFMKIDTMYVYFDGSEDCMISDKMEDLWRRLETGVNDMTSHKYGNKNPKAYELSRYPAYYGPKLLESSPKKKNDFVEGDIVYYSMDEGGMTSSDDGTVVPVGICVVPAKYAKSNEPRFVGIKYLTNINPDEGSYSPDVICFGNPRTDLCTDPNHKFCKDSTIMCDDGIHNTQRMIAYISSHKRSDPNNHEGMISMTTSAGCSPLASVVWRYHTPGTTQGQWYIPSIDEIYRMGLFYDKIKEAREKLGLPMYSPIPRYWSSSSNSKDTAYVAYMKGDDGLHSWYTSKKTQFEAALPFIKITN